MLRLSGAQKRALANLSGDWKSAYDLEESLPTLYALTKHGLAESRGETDRGAGWIPRIVIQFRKLTMEVAP